MPSFTTVEQLEKYIKNGIVTAVEDTQDMVKERMDIGLEKFYGEYTPGSMSTSKNPWVYDRKEKLKKSAFENPIVITGNGAVASVQYRADEMSYDDGTWDGQTVLHVAMLGSRPHGGVPVGSPVWTRVQEELTYAVPPYIGSSLIAAGVPVQW